MSYSIPLYHSFVRAGFPSPADDFIEQYLDLNEFLIRSKSSTFFIRVSGDSMINAGIHEDDILIIDRSLNPKNNDVILAILNGEFTVKRYVKKNNQVVLMPENKRYVPKFINSYDEFEVWGVVTNVIHKP